MELTNVEKRNLVVMTVRIFLGPDARYERLDENPLFSTYEQQLFMRVVALSEKAGKDMDLPSGGERGMEHFDTRSWKPAIGQILPDRCGEKEHRLLAGAWRRADRLRSRAEEGEKTGCDLPSGRNFEDPRGDGDGPHARQDCPHNIAGRWELQRAGEYCIRIEARLGTRRSFAGTGERGRVSWRSLAAMEDLRNNKE